MSSVLIGTKPSQIPTNADLGSMAYQNKEAVQIDYLSVGDTGVSASPLNGMTNQLINTNSVLRFENKPVTIESIRSASVYGLTKYSPGLNSTAVVTGGMIESIYPLTTEDGTSNTFTLTTMNGWSGQVVNLAPGKIGAIQGITGTATNWLTTSTVVNNINVATGANLSFGTSGYGVTNHASGATMSANITSLNAGSQPVIWMYGSRSICTNNSGNGAVPCNLPIGIGAQMYVTMAGGGASTITDGFGIVVSQAQGTAGINQTALTPLGGTAVGPNTQGTGGGTVTNAYGIYVGKVYGQTSQYGLYLDVLAGPGATKYTIYSADTTAPAQFMGPIVAGNNVTASVVNMLDVSCGFSVIGNNNTVTLPTNRPASGGCAFSWNQTNGNGETNIYNLYSNGSAGALSFMLSQITGSQTKTDLVKVYNNGNVTITGELTVAGAAWSTYTPTVTPVGGTITSLTAAGRYKQIGKTVFVRIDILITNGGGGGAGALNCSLPPITPSSISNSILSGREIAINGWAVNGTVTTSTIYICKYDNAYPLTAANNQRIILSGEYEAA